MDPRMDRHRAQSKLLQRADFVFSNDASSCCCSANPCIWTKKGESFEFSNGGKNMMGGSRISNSSGRAPPAAGSLKCQITMNANRFFFLSNFRVYLWLRLRRRRPSTVSMQPKRERGLETRLGWKRKLSWRHLVARWRWQWRTQRCQEERQPGPTRATGYSEGCQLRDPCGETGLRKESGVVPRRMVRRE